MPSEGAENRQRKTVKPPRQTGAVVHVENPDHGQSSNPLRLGRQGLENNGPSLIIAMLRGEPGDNANVADDPVHVL